MDYINPTAIAGMYNVPKDTSLPGSGHGLTQGFLEGQAANRANDFLNMSQLAQAQDYAGQQFKNQLAWQMAPLEQEAKRLGNQHTQAQIAQSGLDQDKARAFIEKMKQEGKLDKFIAASRFHEPFKNAKSDMEKRAALEQYNYFMKQMDPNHTQYDWDGSPDTWNRLTSDVGIAGEIAKINRDYAQKSGLMGEEYGYKGDMQSNQIRSNEKIAGMEAGTRKYAADVNATKAGRGQTKAELDAELLARWEKLPDGDPTKIMIERILTQSYTAKMDSTTPARQGEAAKAKVVETLKGLKDLQKEGKNPEAGQYDSVLKFKGLDPSKYEVRIENGRMMAYPK